MYKRLFAFCVIFVMIFSLMAANAAKLSDLDMSKIELVKESKIDVESVSVGAEFGNPPAGWTYQFVLGEKPKIAEADGNKYIASNGFWQMFHEPVEEKYYMFSVDVKVSGNKTLVFLQEPVKRSSNTSLTCQTSLNRTDPVSMMALKHLEEVECM